MIKNKKRLILIILAVIVLIPFLYSYYSYSEIKVTNRDADAFSERLIAAVNQKEEFDMRDVADFQWDTMMVFYPYTSQAEMEKKVGFEWTTYGYIGYHLIQNTFLGEYPLDDESFNKVVFIKGEEVVLDVTFKRRQIDLTQINQVIDREEAKFYVSENVLEQRGGSI